MVTKFLIIKIWFLGNNFADIDQIINADNCFVLYLIRLLLYDTEQRFFAEIFYYY